MKETHTQVRCPQCKHSWLYKGMAEYVTCPSCRKLFSRIKTKIEEAVESTKPESSAALPTIQDTVENIK